MFTEQTELSRFSSLQNLPAKLLPKADLCAHVRQMPLVTLHAGFPVTRRTGNRYNRCDCKGVGNKMKARNLAALLTTALLSLSSVVAQTITIGFTTSQTGNLAKGSQEQFRGYELWRTQVNDNGGLKVGDKRYKVQFVQHDDKSSPSRVGELYKELIESDHADFLFSPYSSGLDDAAAVVTEKFGKIMVVTN